MNINETITQLKSYSGPFKLTLHPSASEALIKDMENAYGFELPQDFKSFYRFTNGFEIDEDIFNMIPLGEMIGNSKDDKHPSIAEYMIYSDMWHLEINTDDPNQYEIYVLDYDSEKIVLTNSLAEFIARFLKGGVFKIGGLYAWKDEIKAKIYGRTDPDQLTPLFGAWRECLALGLTKVEQVKQYVDWIIATEDDPHVTFIEISLSKDLDELVIILDSLCSVQDVLQTRLILSKASTALLINQISPNKALTILEHLRFKGHFTEYEKNEIDGFLSIWDQIVAIPKQGLQIMATERLKKFLNNYTYFNFDNHRVWPSINAHITEVFNNKAHQS